MSALFKRMSYVVEDFVQQESRDGGVVGILVFGSFVKGKVGMTSDIDLLVASKGIEEWSRTRQRHDGIFLEIYRWPLNLFAKPFLGEWGDVFSDAFCFEVMRNGRILYDPKGILERFRRYAQTHGLPSSHIRSLSERAHRSLRLAKDLLRRRELEGAELEVRRASEELAGAILLERDILEITPAKIYVPHLREEALDFYSLFREIHNLNGVHRKEVETAIQDISGRLKRLTDEANLAGKEEWLKPGGAINGAQTELLNARDCLEKGDLEAALLQVRYSAMLVASSMLGLRGTPVDSLDRRDMELLRSDSICAGTLRSVMHFRHEEPRLKEHIRILEDIAQRHG